MGGLNRQSEPQLSWATALMLVAAIFGGASGIVWALGLDPITMQGLVATAGIAGLTTSAGASGIRLIAASSPEIDRNQPALLVALSIALGFLAGSASLLVTVTVLSVNPSEVTPSGSALLGGVYGLIFGTYWAGVAESSSLRRALMSPRPNEIQAVTDGVKRINWKGAVQATLTYEGGDRVSGKVEVWFEGEPSSIPKARHWYSRLGATRAPRDSMTAGPEESIKTRSTASGQLVIEGGQDADNADFVVTVSSLDGMDVFPRRQLVQAPVSGRSESYHFTLLRSQKETDQQESASIMTAQSVLSPGRALTARDANDHSQAASRQQAALVEIAMSGRTVQILEVKAE